MKNLIDFLSSINSTVQAQEIANNESTSVILLPDNLKNISGELLADLFAATPNVDSFSLQATAQDNDIDNETAKELANFFRINKTLKHFRYEMFNKTLDSKAGLIFASLSYSKILECFTIFGARTLTYEAAKGLSNLCKNSSSLSGISLNFQALIPDNAIQELAEGIKNSKSLEDVLFYNINNIVLSNEGEAFFLNALKENNYITNCKYLTNPNYFTYHEDAIKYSLSNREYVNKINILIAKAAQQIVEGDKTLNAKDLITLLEHDRKYIEIKNNKLSGQFSYNDDERAKHSFKIVDIEDFFSKLNYYKGINFLKLKVVSNNTTIPEEGNSKEEVLEVIEQQKNQNDVPAKLGDFALFPFLPVEIQQHILSFAALTIDEQRPIIGNTQEGE
jgi:hypothetical protein